MPKYSRKSVFIQKPENISALNYKTKIKLIYAMVQATGKSSGHSVKKIRAFKEMLRSFKEISHFSSQTSTLILPTILFYFKKF